MRRVPAEANSLHGADHDVDGCGDAGDRPNPLADFGIAFRADGPSAGPCGSTLGTAAYLSPERVLGETAMRPRQRPTAEAAGLRLRESVGVAAGRQAAA